MILNKLKQLSMLPPHIPFGFEHEDVQNYLERTQVKRVSLVEKNNGVLLCEVEDKEGNITHLGKGVFAVGIWLRMKAVKENEELPSYLLDNE